MNNCLTETARKLFMNDRYATELTGIEIVSVSEHQCICSLLLVHRHCNARDTVMGGVLFTLADFAAAVAANSENLSKEELHWVSLNAHIHYLVPALLGQRLTATCTALKHGRSTALYQTIIESPDSGKRIAVIGTTMMRV